MKKYIKNLVIYTALLIFVIPVNAQQIKLNEAHIAATYAMLEEYEEEEREYIIKELSVTETNTYSVKDTIFMYEVLFNNGKGILLSGNKNCLPVLGHLGNAKVSIFDKDAPCCLTDFIEGYIYQIRESFVDKKGNLENVEKWHSLLAGNINKAPVTTMVRPLTTSIWGQDNSNDYDPNKTDVFLNKTIIGDCKAYNYYVTESNNVCSKDCDAKNVSNKCPAGCTAVAMAQIMYYWKYPLNYDWCNMQDSLSTILKIENCREIRVPYLNGGWIWIDICDTTYNANYEKERNAVAHLIRECGVKIWTEYCRKDKCASGAYIIDAATALQISNNYNANFLLWPQTRVNKVKENLDKGQPILFSGWGPGDIGGHSFVCDGYKSNNTFHFNWGWNGNYNGIWFKLDNIYVGEGSYWNINAKAVFDIYPKGNVDYCNYNRTLNSTLAAVTKYQTNLIVDFTNSTYNTINSGQNVEYRAHNSIVIKPGFHAKSGSTVRMHIEPCANCPERRTPNSAPPRPNTDFETEDENFNILNSESSISVFPNPTTGIVNIISHNTKIESISVFDISGKTLQNNASFAGTTLDLSWLSNGIYFVKIQTPSEQVTHKIIIQK